jgi:hypothetical protein
MYPNLLFQHRINSKQLWKNMDECLFMDSLYKYNNKLSHLVRVMLQGKILHYPDGQYRIIENQV